MLDGNTLLFVLAGLLFVGSLVAFLAAMAGGYSQHLGAPGSSGSTRSLVIALAMLLASAALHWSIGTWAWFAWSWAVIAALVAILVATTRFALPFRIGAPAILVALSAAALFPVLF